MPEKLLATVAYKDKSLGENGFASFVLDDTDQEVVDINDGVILLAGVKEDEGLIVAIDAIHYVYVSRMPEEAA